MYPRNAASPPRIAVGAVIQISDGVVQTSNISAVIRVAGGAEAAGGGTVHTGASGMTYYTPLTAETDYTDFCVTLTKTGCIPVAQTVITGEAVSIVMPPLTPSIFNPVTLRTDTILISRGDTRRVTFSLSTDYTGWTAYFGARTSKTDAAYKMAERACTWTTIAEGEGYFDLTTTDTATAGDVFAEIELRNGTQRLTVLAWRISIIPDVVR